jgi:outer membrane protein OmpA-like peptidoglycan-associated protein
VLALVVTQTACMLEPEPQREGNRQHAARATPEQCYVVEDVANEGGDDILFLVQKDGPNAGMLTRVPMTGNLGAGVNSVEAIAFDPTTDILYAADAEQLGTVDVDTGVFEALAEPFGAGNGTIGGTPAVITFDDVDGLAFDPSTGDLWGSVRREPGTDLLIRIDTTSGRHVSNAFGIGIDYLEIIPVHDQPDIDALAIDLDGVIYAIATSDDDEGDDYLVTIDRTTGVATQVGSNDPAENLGVDNFEGMGFDTAGQLWGTGGSDTGKSLYRINKTTGVADPVSIPLSGNQDFESIDCLTGPLPDEPDAGPGPGPDAGPEPGPDAGPEPGPDAGPGPGPAPDAGPGPGPDPGGDWSVIGGSNGCSAGPGAAGTGWALLLGLLALGLHGRKRGRGAGRTLVRTSGTLLVAAAITAMASAPASAQVTGEFTLERFRISLDREGVLDSEWGRTLGHLRWDLGLWLGLANDPLVVVQRMDDGEYERIGSLVSQRVGGNLVGTIGLLSWAQIGAEVPLILSQDQDIGMSPVGTGGSISSFGLGDIRIVPKVRLLNSDDHYVDFALIPAITLPTSTSDEYFGEGGLALAPEIALSRAFGATRLATNLGYRMRDSKTLGDLTVDDEIFWRIAGGYRFADAGGMPFEVDLSLTTAARSSDFLDAPNNNHMELLGAVQYTFSKPLLGFVAGGYGLNEGFGTPDWRVLIGARFAVERSKDEPLVVVEPPKPAPAPAPEPACAGNDRDCDTVPDPATPGPGQPPDTDYCPDQPGMPRYHGCPEPAVAVNECGPIQVSPALAFADAQDALIPASTVPLDALARVLKEQHSAARVSIEVGDEAANRELAEKRASAILAYLTAQGVNPDNLAAIGHGAPAASEPAQAGDDELAAYPVAFAVVCPEKETPPCKNLALDKKIEFEVSSAVIRPASLEMLKRDVVWVLQAHQDVRVTIEGHTSGEGKLDYNLSLSQRRAEAVREYLSSQGIDLSRLKATGYGPKHLLIKPEKSEADREQNRRIEFRITAGGSCAPCTKIQVGKIQFEYNSDKIKPESFPELDHVVRQLEDRADVHLRIEGHTSSEGRAAHNKRLSGLRAAAVRKYLIERGIAASRLGSIGHGAERLLVTPDATEEEREKNRRVEFAITQGGACPGDE